MKRLIILSSIIAFSIISASSCQSNGASGTRNADSAKIMADEANYTTASFVDSVQDFGKVPQGEQVKILFHVKNTGTKPLLIAEAKPSCGCTVADFTKSAIAPGKEGEITGTFDSNHGMPGEIHKTITVVTNTSPVHNRLVFTGTVIPKDSTKAK